MTPLVADKLRDLGRVLADLKVRVRAALATELGRHVATAVEDVVRAVIAGRPLVSVPESYRGYHPGSDRSRADDGWDRPGDPWAADPDRDGYDPDDGSEPPVSTTPAGSGLAAAVAAGVFAARWWLARRGTLAAAAGLGLAVGLLGVLGGPVARTAVAALAAAADLLAATDALGCGAARLDHP